MRHLAWIALLVGCAATASSRPPSAGVAARAPSGEGAPPCWLVWIRTTDGTTTRRVCSAEDATERWDGLVVDVEGERRHLVIREHRAAAVACDDMPPPSPPRDVIGRSLDLLGASEQVLLEPPELEDLEYVEDEIDILTTLGPYLAVRRALYVHHMCGSHPYGEPRTYWIDLRDGHFIDLQPTSIDAVALADAMLPVAHAEGVMLDIPDGWLRQRAVMLAAGSTPAEEYAVLSARVEQLVADATEIESLIPHWDGEHWRARPRATIFIGECCDPLEALLPPIDLPEPVAVWADPPEAVRRVVASQEGVITFGWCDADD